MLGLPPLPRGHRIGCGPQAPVAFPGIGFQRLQVRITGSNCEYHQCCPRAPIPYFRCSSIEVTRCQRPCSHGGHLVGAIQRLVPGEPRSLRPTVLIPCRAVNADADVIVFDVRGV